MLCSRGVLSDQYAETESDHRTSPACLKIASLITKIRIRESDVLPAFCSLTDFETVCLYCVVYCLKQLNVKYITEVKLTFCL